MLVRSKDGSIVDIVQVKSSGSYMQDGSITTGSTSSIMIDSESDLDTLTDSAPGTIAYTTGFKKMWKLSTSGSWVEV